MITIIKRKSDGAFVGTVVSGMTPQQEIEINVIPNFGGAQEDYEAVEYTPEPLPPQPEEPLINERLEALEDTVLLLMMEGVM